MKNTGFNSVTKFLFITTQVTALIWVTISYAIAAYATIRLETPYPVESLSTQAIITILGSSALKVIENIFEHNDSNIFGTSNSSKDKDVIDEYDRI